MLNRTVHERIKELTKQLNTTQASLSNELIRFALESISEDQLSALGVVSAKKKGRKKKAVEVVETVTAEAAVEAALTEVCEIPEGAKYNEA